MDNRLSSSQKLPQPKQRNILHNLFEITIFMKGIHGIWEVAVGIMFFFIKTQTVYNVIMAVAGYDIVKDSGHFATNYLMNQANNFSLSTKYFLAWYFLFYGLVNLFLVFFLLKGKLWAYPMAILFFVFFICYQFFRFFRHHSGLLLFFTLFDIFLVFLTWLEYQGIKKEQGDLPKPKE
jgi:uncharacterized membrane protein